MKIAIVVNSFPTISESFIFNKVIGLSEKGFEITVIAFDTKSDDSFYQDRLKNRHIVKLYVPSSIKLLLTSGYLFRFPMRVTSLFFTIVGKYGFRARALKTFLKTIPFKLIDFDIIHFEMSGIAAESREILDLLRSAKLYLSCRGSAEKVKPLIDKGRAEILQEIFKKMDRVHCVSEDMLKTIGKYGLKREKGFVNRPSIFPELFTRSVEYVEHKRLRIISVGRLTWAKGYVFALQAMRKLKADGLDFCYEIIGDGEDFAMMTYLIQEFNLQDDVLLLGKKSRATIREKLENSDVFLLSSLYEGISNAVLEAMAMEVPVVSTKAGGMEEAIEDGVSGYLVNCFSYEEIAQTLLNISSDFEKRKKIGRQGKERILSEFQMSRQIEVFAKEYGAN